MDYKTRLQINIYYAFTGLAIITILTILHAHGVWKQYTKTKAPESDEPLDSSIYLSFVLIMFGLLEALDFVLELLINDKFYRIAAYAGPGNISCLSLSDSLNI